MPRVAHLITRFGERTILLTGLINAGVGSLLRATGELVPAIAGSFVLGFALPWIVVAAITTSQRFTPHGLQGRMSAALTFALFAPLPVTQAIGAAVITQLDYRTLYIWAAALQIAVVAPTLILDRFSRRRDHSASHKESPS